MMNPVHQISAGSVPSANLKMLDMQILELPQVKCRVGIVLAEQVVSSLPENRSVGIIHPSTGRKEMLPRPIGITLDLLFQFLVIL